MHIKAHQAAEDIDLICSASCVCAEQVTYGTGTTASSSSLFHHPSVLQGVETNTVPRETVWIWESILCTVWWHLISCSAIIPKMAVVYWLDQVHVLLLNFTVK